MAVVLKGKGCVPDSEKCQYPAGVDVYWQPKAWLDGKVLAEWVERTWTPFIREHFDGVPTLLVQDNLSHQTCAEYREAHAQVYSGFMKFLCEFRHYADLGILLV